MEEDVVDVGVGVDGALRGGWGFHRPVAISLKAAGPLGCLPSEVIGDNRNAAVP